ncbi:MAG: DUF3990 domain-containing protein [Thermoguttaceae bacterium]
MKLYHGSLVAVDRPRILPLPNARTVDFGNGFYTTTDYGQARAWVVLRRRRHQKDGGFISEYEVPDDLLQTAEFKTLIFATANQQWLEFVVKNRRDTHFDHGYDLVAGPVANDRVYTTLTLFEGDLLDVYETLKRLKTYKLANQILFHTEKSLSVLRYIKSEEVL